MNNTRCRYFQNEFLRKRQSSNLSTYPFFLAIYVLEVTAQVTATVYQRTESEKKSFVRKIK